jgi:hypothetical protein
MGARAMHMMTDEINDSLRIGPRKRVSIRRYDKDFVVAFQLEDFVIFRNGHASALRKVCHWLRWEIVSDTVPEANDPAFW